MAKYFWLKERITPQAHYFVACGQITVKESKAEDFEAFELDSDDGENLYCLLNGCAHLGGGDWEILSEDEIDAMVDDLRESVE